jgi:hypothetical protein
VLLSQEQVPSLLIQHLPNRLRFTLQQKIARAAHLYYLGFSLAETQGTPPEEITSASITSASTESTTTEEVTGTAWDPSKH